MEVDLSRYISLNDSVSIADIARVRVAAGNLNFNHLVIQPNEEAALLPWPKIRAAVQAAAARASFPGILQADRAILRR